MIVLFVGMVFTQLSAVADGKTYNFWASGHMVYLECVLLANFVMLRATHNWTFWGELFLFVQVLSFFVFLYLDSVWFTNPIAHFFDEYFSSKTAWLGCFLVIATIYIEKACLDAYELFRPLKSVGVVDHEPLAKEKKSPAEETNLQ